MKSRALQHSLVVAANAIGHPAALIAVAAFAAAWWWWSPRTLEWHAVATLVTLVMAILIERNQTRDRVALQAKLDELILHTQGARNELTQLEKKDLEEVEELVSEASTDLEDAADAVAKAEEKI